MQSRTAICFSLVVAVAYLSGSSAAPSEKLSKLSQDDLAQAFTKFLHEDKEMAAALENFKGDMVHHVLRKRQAEEADDIDMAAMDPDKQAGFFDRAAKFVLELVQRFLKWINTE